MMYEELISSLRLCRQILHEDDKCIEFVDGGCEAFPVCAYQLMEKAADAIEGLNSQLEDFKCLCLPLKENRLYKFADGSLTELTLMIVPREPTEPPKEE